MKFKDICKIAFLSSILVSTSLLAKPHVSTVNLGGGNIAPAGLLNIYFSKLVPEAKYTLTCQIIDPNNALNQAILFVKATNSTAPISVNGVQIDNGQGEGQVKLSGVSNVLKIDPVANVSGSGLTLRNVDQNDGLIVSNCVAQGDG